MANKPGYETLIDNYLADGYERNPCVRCGNFDFKKNHEKRDPRRCNVNKNECWQRGGFHLANESLRDSVEDYWQQQVHNIFKTPPVTKPPPKSEQGATSQEKQQGNQQGGIPAARTFSRSEYATSSPSVGYKYYRKNPLGKCEPPGLDANMVWAPSSTATLNGLASTSIGESQIDVITNYVQITQVPSSLIQYSIKNSYTYQEKGKPRTVELKRKWDLAKIFDAAREKLEAEGGILHGKDWASDFCSIWSHSELFNHKDNKSHTIVIDYVAQGGRQIDELEVTITYVNNLSNIDDMLKHESIATSETQGVLPALNAIVSNPVREDDDITQVGPNKFFLQKGFERMTALRAHRGYFTSVRPSKIGPLLNINTCTSAFFAHGHRVTDVLDEINSHSDLRSQVGVSGVEEMLKGVSVRVAHRRAPRSSSNLNLNHEHGRIKTFKGFGKSIENQEFPQKEKGSDSVTMGRVLDYFTQDVGIKKGLDKDGLCVNVGQQSNQSNEGACWIPAQLLEIEPYQTMRKELSGEQTTQMLRAANRKPAGNLKLIVEEGLKILKLDKQPKLNAMKMNVETKLIKLHAKIFATPKLSYRDPRGALSNVTPQFASWNLANKRFYAPCSITKLNAFFLTDNGSQECAFADQVRRDAAKRLSYHGAIRIPGYLPGKTGVFNDVAALEEFFKPLDKDSGTTLVALPYISKDNYAHVKRMADIVSGFHTVCAVIDKFASLDHNRWLQYLSNLAMKFNIKAGGLNHKLVDGVLDQYLPKRNTTVIFGADVTHPPAGSMVGYPSIACVVGSVDNNFQNYPGSMRLQAGRQERIEDLNEMVEERLEAWYAHRGRKPFPTSILFYRDGISESQFAECKEKEVAAIRTGFSAFATKHDNPTASCKVTFVVVGKRHHTRFFPPSKEESYTTGKTPPAGKAPIVNGNVQPGLFVDEVITAPEDYNFFLQSHSAIQGTARSAHYTVLEDKMGLISRNEKTGVVDGSNLANLTHNLCYSYARATTGVSYVAPAYIADRLCERGRVYLRDLKGSNHSNRFRMNKPQPGQQHSKKDVENFKAECVKYVAKESGLWGHYNDDTSAGQTKRMNPWHPNLDYSMFWM